MAVSYPDIIGEYLTTTERFANGGLQYAGYFEPAAIPSGQVANLFLFLQNTQNVPLTVALQIDVPKTGGFFRSKKPMLAVKQSNIIIELSSAEAGLLTLPVTTTDHTKEGDYNLTINVKTETQGRGKRIRPKKYKSPLGNQLIDNPVGLDLVASLGANYEEKSAKKASFSLKIGGSAETLQRAPKLTHSYEPIWQEKNITFYNQAIQEINAREVKLKKDLTVEQIYVNLYAESVARFADAGLPMRIGEAVAMAKILTYSCQYFLSSPNRRNGLLVPIWQRALEQGVDTTDTLDLLRTVGFHHVIRVSVAIGFGIVARASKKQLWSLTERQALANHIADKIEVGQPLDLEFLYLPLLMAGTQICGKVRMQGEDVSHSLALIQTARQARKDLFLDQDMAKADELYNNILKNAAL